MPDERKQIEQRCTAVARRYGAMHAKLDGVNKDWPDHLYLFPGPKLLIVEFKQPTKEPRARQSYLISELRHRGATVAVVYGVVQFREILSELLKEKVPLFTLNS